MMNWLCLDVLSCTRNDRRMNLGTRQNGVVLDDVVLPPWANGSAEEFIRLQRQALEGEHVSRVRSLHTTA